MIRTGIFHERVAKIRPTLFIFSLATLVIWLGLLPNVLAGDDQLRYQRFMAEQNRYGSDTQVTWQEGCLSFPMLFLSVQRPEEITVRYTKADGDTRIEVRMDGRDARIFLHEYDHLQGTVFLDHVSLLKLNRAKEQRKKLFKKFRKAQKQHS